MIAQRCAVVVAQTVGKPIQMQSDYKFGSSISDAYEAYLVPLIFEPYATDVATRLASRSLTRVLEIAAGTGVVTRAMASTLPPNVSIVATDLNQTMLDQAIKTGTSRAVEWRQADAMNLPFPDKSFDAVVCQFGVMFFPDKKAAFGEARRVLRDGGVFLFSVWDDIRENEFAMIVTDALKETFPDNPALFMARTPHGYFDQATIERDLRSGGFTGSITAETVAALTRPSTAHDVAKAYCHGTPLRDEIEARDARGLDAATNAAGEAIAARFGTDIVAGKIQARVFTVS